MNQKNLEMNITDDNNFFVSNSFVEKIRYALKEKPSSVTNDEIQLLKKVEERKDICAKLNIHYFVLPDPSTSLGGYCHWCNITTVEYAKGLKVHRENDDR